MATTSWDPEDAFWREHYHARPYARIDRDYTYYEPAYRYGYESAGRYHGRAWDDIESDLRRDWDSYEHRGSARSTWEDMKAAVRDAWDRVTGRQARS